MDFEDKYHVLVIDTTVTLNSTHVQNTLPIENENDTRSKVKKAQDYDTPWLMVVLSDSMHDKSL